MSKSEKKLLIILLGLVIIGLLARYVVFKDAIDQR